MKESFCIIVPVFWKNRITRFIESLEKNPPGCEFDIVFVHNFYEKETHHNRIDATKGRRTDEEADFINYFLLTLKEKELFKNSRVILRENIGEDFGATRHGYYIFKGQYKYFLFINEIIVFKQPSWLVHFKEVLDACEGIMAVSNAVCQGIKYQYCLRSSCWGGRDSFLQQMDWPISTCRQDCEIQEMEMVYPQVKALNGLCAQPGCGNDLLNYFYDDGREYGLDMFTFFKPTIIS